MLKVDYNEIYEAVWKPLLETDGERDEDKLRRELADYYVVLKKHQVSLDGGTSISPASEFVSSESCGCRGCSLKGCFDDG